MASDPPTPTEQLASIIALLEELRDQGAPNNKREQLKYTSSQVAAGTWYDYHFPEWCRNWILFNTSSTKNIYYLFDESNTGLQGGLQLPQIYATLPPQQSLSEKSIYPTLSIYADAASSDQGWELRYEGFVRKVA